MNNVDLEAISIDPNPIQQTIGKSVTITAIIGNNGPDEIPKGEARAHVTLSQKHLIVGWGKNIGFKNLVGKSWTFIGTKRIAGKYELYFQNDGGALKLAGGDFNGFSFTVKTRKVGTTDVTMVVGLNPKTATVGDGNDKNQFVSCEVIILPKKKK